MDKSRAERSSLLDLIMDENAPARQAQDPPQFEIVNVTQNNVRNSIVPDNIVEGERGVQDGEEEEELQIEEEDEGSAQYSDESFLSEQSFDAADLEEAPVIAPKIQVC